MPALQVRDFPQALYDSLKLYSEREHRSMSQQTIIAVEKMLASEAPYPTQVAVPSRSRFGFSTDQQIQKRIDTKKSLFDRLDSMNIDISDDLPDPVMLIRESRDERDERNCALVAASSESGSECW